MIKIATLYRAANGAMEPVKLDFTAEDFGIPELEGPVHVHGKLLRVDEGIMLLIDKLEATQNAHCSRCGKALKLPLNFKPSEWLFYEEEANEDDDSDERLQLDTHRLELDPLEPVRQDILLNLETTPRCKKTCKKFEEAKEGDQGVKALAGLKDLVE